MFASVGVTERTEEEDGEGGEGGAGRPLHVHFTGHDYDSSRDRHFSVSVPFGVAAAVASDFILGNDPTRPWPPVMAVAVAGSAG